MLNYGAQKITAKDLAAVRKVLTSDYLTQGPVVRDFEEAVAKYVGADYAVAVNSGTAALTIAYQASQMTRLVTSLNTFVATANAALLANMETIEFRDINTEDGCWLAPYTPTPGHLYVPVNYAGNIAQVPDDIAPQTIEDSCHSMTYRGNTLAACFSFHPVKHITTGEGGMIVTNNRSFYKDCLELRDHGRRKGWSIDISGNYRMSDIQAALGLSQLESLPDFMERRLSLQADYHRLLSALPVKVAPSNKQPHLLPIICERRDGLQRWLAENGVNTAIHYPPVNMHPLYQNIRMGRTHAEYWYEHELSLPLHPNLLAKDVRKVCSLIGEFYANS